MMLQSRLQVPSPQQRDTGHHRVGVGHVAELPVQYAAFVQSKSLYGSHT